MKCINCGVSLTFSNWGNIRDINNKPVLSCRNCANEILTKLKQDYYVETYKGQEIYCYDGRFVPYWGCAYYFDSIEGVRQRIDNKNVAIVPTDGWKAYGHE